MTPVGSSPAVVLGTASSSTLWEKGTRARFIRFPREGHGIREHRHERVRCSEEIAWMQKYANWVHLEREAGGTATENR